MNFDYFGHISEIHKFNAKDVVQRNFPHGDLYPCWILLYCRLSDRQGSRGSNPCHYWNTHTITCSKYRSAGVAWWGFTDPFVAPEINGKQCVPYFFFSLSEGTIFWGDNFSGLVARGQFFGRRDNFPHDIFVSLYSGPVVLKGLIPNVNLNLRRRRKFWIWSSVWTKNNVWRWFLIVKTAHYDSAGNQS